MSVTYHSLIKKPRKKLYKNNKRPALNFAPQRKGYCIRTFTLSPRKPNSAKRKSARVHIRSTKKIVNIFIPGIGHNLQKHGSVWIRGGRVRDLPGMKYRAIRGKGDLSFVKNRIHSRSKYGTKKRSNKKLFNRSYKAAKLQEQNG